MKKIFILFAVALSAPSCVSAKRSGYDGDRDQSAGFAERAEMIEVPMSDVVAKLKLPIQQIVVLDIDGP